MFAKTKNNNLLDIARQAGYVFMAGIATLGMVELPDHMHTRVIIPGQASFALATSNPNYLQSGNSIRRESEEVAPHYISYGATQRTPGRSKDL